MSRLDQMLSNPNRLTYLFNAIWLILLIWSIYAHNFSGILINGIILFVWNYPWLKCKYLYVADRVRTFIGRRMAKYRKAHEPLPPYFLKEGEQLTQEEIDDFDGDFD